MNIGKKIKRLRILCGLTQEELPLHMGPKSRGSSQLSEKLWKLGTRTSLVVQG